MTGYEIEKERRKALEAAAVSRAFGECLARLGKMVEADPRRALMLVELLDKQFAEWRSKFS